MKNHLLPLVLILCTATAALHAQVSGNYQEGTPPAAPAAANYNYEKAANYNYNNQQNYATASRMPAITASVIKNNEIIVGVNGLMNLVPESYVAMFNLVQVAETSSQTDELMNERIHHFKQQLAKIGFNTTLVKTDMISFVPKFELQPENRLFSKSYNEVPAGFEMQKNVTVPFKNSQQVDAIVSAAAAAEIYDLAKVDCYVPNLQLCMDTLRLRCLQQIKAKNKNYEVVGFKLDTLRKTMADNFVTTYPETRYFSYKAYSRPSLGSVKKKAQVTFNDAAQLYSKFYNQIDYDHYDLVINPVITEPVVQLSYSVVVKYFLKDEDKTKPVYYMVSSTGEVKPFSPK